LAQQRASEIFVEQLDLMMEREGRPDLRNLYQANPDDYDRSFSSIVSETDSQVEDSEMQDCREDSEGSESTSSMGSQYDSDDEPEQPVIMDIETYLRYTYVHAGKYPAFVSPLAMGT
jgi:hypothetical protein